MSLRLRKVTFVVHVDQYDEDGNLASEHFIDRLAPSGEPLTLYPHQIGELGEHVKNVVAIAEQQLEAG